MALVADNLLSCSLSSEVAVARHETPVRTLLLLVARTRMSLIGQEHKRVTGQAAQTGRQQDSKFGSHSLPWAQTG